MSFIKIEEKRKMHEIFASDKKRIRGKRRILNAITLTLILTFSALMTAAPAAIAHTPPQTYNTYAYIVASANPTGVGETVYIVIWISPNPRTSTGLGGDRWRGMTITITEPDGHTSTLGPFYSDPTGSTYTTYTPTQVGTYQLTLTYPGQVMSLYGPGGPGGLESSVNMSNQIQANLADLIARGGDQYVNDTFLGSSATTSLVVQQQPIPHIPDTPLPTNYWTRPIYGENHNWASVASNWLAGSQIGGYGNIEQTGVAPNSPHIMWTRQIETGGIVGGNTLINDVGFYSGGSYEGRFTNAMIMDGRLYYAEPLGHSATGGGYTCVDITTGQVLWHSDDIAVTYPTDLGKAPNTPIVPTFGQLFDYESQNQHGVVGGILWASVIQSGVRTWIGYDAFTGKWVFNETNVPLYSGPPGAPEATVLAYTPQGQYVRYVLDYNAATHSGSIALWNNTQDNIGIELQPPYSNESVAATTNAYQWRPNGKTVDMSRAYSWNVTFSADLSGSAAPYIVQVIPGDIILGASTTFYSFIGNGVGTANPYTIWAISDKPETRGQLLWKHDYVAPSGDITRSFSLWPIDTVNRVFYMRDIETIAWLAYSLDSGDLVWGPESYATDAFSYYGSGLGGGPIGWPANGNLYAMGYGGEIICYSGKDGSLVWKFNNTNSGVETPWGNYPTFISVIADGKVYAFNNEHSPNYPLYKGEKVYCLDANTGEELWSMLSWAGQSGGAGASTSVEADGYLVYYNYYDNQLYCIGKGPSATTVEAPLTAISPGSSVTIQGTVTDISAGTQQNQQAANFPNGVPAVSDDSMSGWMEFVYMQQACPANVKGVPVTLTALDPNGNTETIGTVTTDAAGMYNTMWTPPVPGLYTISATFAGTNSYYPSFAETSIGVGTASSPAPTSISPSPSQAPQPASSISTTIYIVIAAVVIIIAIIAAAVVLRKRK
jgi:outer membrane protein assembly factor BamB